MPPLPPILTADGSATLHHPGARENYHALEGARSEAEVKFVRPSELAARLARGPVVLLDAGFGLGVNGRAAVETAARAAGHPLEVHGVENDPEALDRALSLSPDCPMLRALRRHGVWESPHARVIFAPMDLRHWVYQRAEPVDLVFHDPFSPMKNTEGWTVDLFRAYRRLLADDGAVLTYSEATAVRAGLFQAGFAVGSTPAVSPHRGGTIATPRREALAHPLDPAGFAAFPACVPYRDPTLADSGRTIRARREAEVRNAPPIP